MNYFLLIIGAVFVNNFVLSRFLGICSFLGVSKKAETALGMGLAVIFVMALSSVMSYIVNTYILMPLNMEYMQTITFILVIAALVQMVEMIMKKFSLSLYNALGVYLPLITTNCAVLGVVLLNVRPEYSYNLIEAFLNGTFSGVGYTVSIMLLAGIQEKMSRADIPDAFKGFPISLIAASIMSMAFVIFAGMV